MAIQGLEGLTDEQIKLELKHGAKFVVYNYSISLVLVAFKNVSKIYFIKSGENSVIPGLKYTLISLLLGWFGIRALIYTIQSIHNNLSGGIDVTEEICRNIEI